jgi:retinol-binding protein 3
MLINEEAQGQADSGLDEAARAAVIEGLVARIKAGYVLPDAGEVAIATLREGQACGAYGAVVTPQAFAEKVTSDLRAATHDRHLALFFEPQRAVPAESSGLTPKPRERFNFGFHRAERLRGNIGYLDLRTFADPQEQDVRETASTYLSALANFDATIIDLRQNGGGTTRMVAFVASYFLGPEPVHLTDMYWRDEGRTIDVWTLAEVPGRRSVHQDLYLLVGPSTHSAAEDLCYSLQQLKRATLVGEKTAGGAHMGRGIQRLSPLFTAFIPTGRSLNPLTKSNWENVGVQPDIAVPSDRALAEAHVLALRRLLERERDPGWQVALRRSIDDLDAGK